jgi:hypothetical protein
MKGSIADPKLPAPTGSRRLANETAMPPRGGRFTGYAMVVLLLAIHYALAVTAASTKCNTFDEIVHIAGGYSYWQLNDYRLNPEGDALGQRLMALPLLLGDFKLPPHDDSAAAWAPGDPSRYWRNCDLWNFGHQFFYNPGNNPETMLRLSRSFMALFSVLLGLLVYLWSRRLFGPAGGIVSLALYALCPAFLANGPLSTMDLLASLCFLAALGAFWRMLHRVTFLSVLLSSLAMGALFLAKFSAVLAGPMLLVLLFARVFFGPPLELRLAGTHWVRGRLQRACVLFAAVIVHVLVVWGLIWVSYGMRYESFTSVQQGRDKFYPAVRRYFDSPDNGVIAQAGQETARFVRDYHLLPEAYLHGFLITLDTTGGRYAFFNGDYSTTGWPTFFPYCLAVKTPLSILAFVLLAMLAAAAKRGLAKRGLAPRPFAVPVPFSRISPKSEKGTGTDFKQPNRSQSPFQALYQTLPLWVLMAVYMGSSVASHINIGVRHVLPVYAPALVLCGAAGLWFSPAFRLARVAAAAMLVLLAAETALVWPNYLAYFNPLAGGTSNGYKHVVDSSLDWGQDLPALKRWLDGHSPAGTPVYLSYFGTASPTWYGMKEHGQDAHETHGQDGHATPGIEVNRLPGYRNFDVPNRKLLVYRPGLYCISATMLQGVLDPMTAPWVFRLELRYRQLRDKFAGLAAAKGLDPQSYLELLADNGWPDSLGEYDNLRTRRLIAYLRHRQPEANVNGSILVYRIGPKDIEQAFADPPAECKPDSENPYE